MNRFFLWLTFLFILTSCEFRNNERQKIEMMINNPINLSLDKLKCIGGNIKKRTMYDTDGTSHCTIHCGTPHKH